MPGQQMTRLPFFLPWLRVNLLIRSITNRGTSGPGRSPRGIFRRALEIRRDLARAEWWN
jgi:hypothetical protein